VSLGEAGIHAFLREKAWHRAVWSGSHARPA
jgi:hypothetical protein